MTHNGSEDLAGIERDLAEARGRLDAHLSELANRLSPGQLIDDGLHYLRHGQGAEFARNLGGQLRDNPLPVALTGIGLAWLMAVSAISGKNRRPASWPAAGNGSAFGDPADDIAGRAQRAGEALTRFADESEDDFKARVAEARAQVLGLQREAAETVAAFADRVQQGLERSQQRAREGLARMGEAVADHARRSGEAMAEAAQQGRDMASRAGAAIAETLDQNPMLLGAMGLTAGVLLAALLPVTEQEEALTAPVGGAIRTAADQAVERGKRAGEAAAAAAYREVTAEA